MGVADFMLFGEVFDPAATSTYVRRGLLPSVLDFSYQQSVVPYAAGVSNGRDLASFFDQDDLYTTATSSAYDLVTFLGNHDIGRVGYFLAQSGTASPLAADLLAHDVLLLTRGAPAVYYGDEAGMTGSDDGRDRYARQDMFPTRVAAWKEEPRIGARPIGSGSSFDPSHPIAARITALSSLVERYPALRTGAQITRVGSGPVFAASRVDGADRREYVVAFNNSPRDRTVGVPTSSPSTSFVEIWPREEKGASSDDVGVLRVTVPARSSLIVRADERLPAAGRPRVRLRTPRYDRLLGALRLRADVAGRDPATVTFALRSGSRWVRLGTDDAAPFRITLEADRLERGRPAWVVALARGSSGALSTSDVQRIVPR